MWVARACQDNVMRMATLCQNSSPRGLRIKGYIRRCVAYVDETDPHKTVVELDQCSMIDDGARNGHHPRKGARHRREALHRLEGGGARLGGSCSCSCSWPCSCWAGSMWSTPWAPGGATGLLSVGVCGENHKFAAQLLSRARHRRRQCTTTQWATPLSASGNPQSGLRQISCQQPQCTIGVPNPLSPAMRCAGALVFLFKYLNHFRILFSGV